jgi:hypothetical protein
VQYRTGDEVRRWQSRTTAGCGLRPARRARRTGVDVGQLTRAGQVHQHYPVHEFVDQHRRPGMAGHRIGTRAEAVEGRIGQNRDFAARRNAGFPDEVIRHERGQADSTISRAGTLAGRRARAAGSIVWSRRADGYAKKSRSAAFGLICAWPVRVSATPRASAFLTPPIWPVA